MFIFLFKLVVVVGADRPRNWNAGVVGALKTTSLLVRNSSRKSYRSSHATQPKEEGGAHRRVDMCDVMSRVAAGKLPLEKALSGKHLTVAVPTEPTVKDAVLTANFIQQTKDGHWRGYDAELMKEMSKRGNFTYDLKKVRFEVQSTKDHWEKLQAWALDYDVVIDHIAQTSDGYGVNVVPIYPVSWASLVLVGYRSVYENSWRAWFTKMLIVFEPFDPWVWLGIVVMWCAMAALYWFIEFAYSSEDADTNSAEVVAYTFFMMFAGGIESPGARFYLSRILAMSWAFTCLVILAAYTANLANILVQDTVEHERWHTLDDVFQADARICVRQGFGGVAYMQQQYPAYSNVVIPERNTHPLEAMQKGKCDVALIGLTSFEVASRMNKYNPKCNLFRIGTPLVNRGAGWAAFLDYGDRCTAILIDALRKHFTAMVDEGALLPFYEKDLLQLFGDKKKHCKKADDPSSGEEGKSLKLQNFIGVFSLNFLIGVSLLCFFFSHGAAELVVEEPSDIRSLGTLARAVRKFRGGSERTDEAPVHFAAPEEATSERAVGENIPTDGSIAITSGTPITIEQFRDLLEASNNRLISSLRES